jgi:hypothetical protein
VEIISLGALYVAELFWEGVEKTQLSNVRTGSLVFNVVGGRQIIGRVTVLKMTFWMERYRGAFDVLV